MNSASASRPGRFERLMFRRVPLWLLLFALLASLGGCVVFGTLVRYEIEGNDTFGPVSEGALAVASIPSTLKSLAEDHDPRRSKGFSPLPDGFSEPGGADFTDEGHALVSRFSAERDRAIVQLVRLSDGKVVRDYAPDIAAITRRWRPETAVFDVQVDWEPSRFRMVHPYLMPDGGIVFQNRSPLIRIDACGKVMWTLEGIFHHSLERDADGHFWVGVFPARSRRPNVSEKFREDGIAQVSADGRLLHSESVLTILERNGLSWLYESRPYVDDPIHINDIEPVLTSGPHWRRGDLFLSFNSLSAVMLYRPSTGRILWWRQGMWSGQHDVNILDEHRISIFDNHAIAGFPSNSLRGPNKILVYDFATGAIEEPFSQAMRRHDIRTITEGRATPMDNGDFMIEETNGGRLVRVSPQGELRWQYVAADQEQRRYMLNWSRYVDPAQHGAGVRAAASARCS